MVFLQMPVFKESLINWPLTPAPFPDGARGADLRDIMIEYYAIVQRFLKKTQAQCETQLDKRSGRRICVGQIGGRRKRMAVRP